MTTWQLRRLMAPRMWIEVTGSVCGLIKVDVNLAQTSFEIQLTSLPVSNNATAESLCDVDVNLWYNSLLVDAVTCDS
jgi:hypothetical protein